MLKDLEYFVVAGILFAAIDFVWLSKAMKPQYEKKLGHLLRKKPDMLAAVGFYIIFLVGLVIFVVHPARHMTHGVSYAFEYGALYGLFTYATYELTNLSTLKNWPREVALADWAWGTALSAVVAGLTAVITF